jgi:uncharacterized alpha/beta hydrolase family protein
VAAVVATVMAVTGGSQNQLNSQAGDGHGSLSQGGRGLRHISAQSKPGPVVLVPGYGGNAGTLDQLATRIRVSGRAAIVVHLPGPGTGSLVADAAALNTVVTRVMRHGAPSVDVIGYSAGGVVALLWARRDGGAAVARRIVTLGAPFHGTNLASAAEGLVPGECPIACQQLIPGSSLLVSLGVANPAGLPSWLSLWTTDDMVVTPPDSARLAGAVNVPVQSICPGISITHSQLPVNPTVTAMVLGAIDAGQLQQPSAADCRG